MQVQALLLAPLQMHYSLVIRPIFPSQLFSFFLSSLLFFLLSRLSFAYGLLLTTGLALGSGPAFSVPVGGIKT
jgi:hypothetical protein